MISSNPPNLAHKETWFQRELISLMSVAETSSQQRGPKLSGIQQMDGFPKLTEQCVCTRARVVCSAVAPLPYCVSLGKAVKLLNFSFLNHKMGTKTRPFYEFIV